MAKKARTRSKASRKTKVKKTKVKKTKVGNRPPSSVKLRHSFPSSEEKAIAHNLVADQAAHVAGTKSVLKSMTLSRTGGDVGFVTFGIHRGLMASCTRMSSTCAVCTKERECMVFDADQFGATTSFCKTCIKAMPSDLYSDSESE